MIRKARFEDLQIITDLAKTTREHMIQMGLLQWEGNYPDYAHFLSDYENNGLYIYLENDEIIASISILPENDKPYKELTWLKQNSLVIHRVIVNPKTQKKGIGKVLFTYAIELAKSNNYESIKIDTHPDNFRMQGLILKMGFVKIGYLSRINRLAYELVL
jgi:GNAT superfamily N-acetyltransferase